MEVRAHFESLRVTLLKGGVRNEHCYKLGMVCLRAAEAEISKLELAAGAPRTSGGGFENMRRRLRLYSDAVNMVITRPLTGRGGELVCDAMAVLCRPAVLEQVVSFVGEGDSAIAMGLVCGRLARDLGFLFFSF